MAVTPLYIDDLVTKTTLSDEDLVIIGEGDNAKKMTIAQLKEELGINALNTNFKNLAGMSIYDITQIYDVYDRAGIGFKSWNDAYATPDANYSFILYTKDVAIAITFGGNIYRATNTNPTWEAAGQPVTQSLL